MGKEALFCQVSLSHKQHSDFNKISSVNECLWKRPAQYFARERHLFLTYQHTAFVSELSPWYHACCRMALPTQGMGKLGKLAKGSRMLQVILVILSHSKSYRADLSRDFFEIVRSFRLSHIWQNWTTKHGETEKHGTHILEKHPRSRTGSSLFCCKRRNVATSMGCTTWNIWQPDCNLT